MNKLFITATCLFVSIVSVAQSTQEKIIASLDSFSYNRPQEKTYLQTDKSNYLAGETIWFKTYATLGEKLSILSKVIYVDMTDASGKVVEKQMLKLTDGTAKGGIALKNELAAGNYFLRCYTLWMLNFPAFITHKKIAVLNYTTDKKPATAASNSVAPAINFYPEGGNLVTGLKSVVAFKAIDQYNNPVPVAGTIVNSKNETIAQLVTLHDGMGAFELLPVGGEIYKAVVKTTDGKESTFPLPVVLAEGITLNIDNSNPNKTFVKVERSEKNKAQYNNLIVMAQINYQLAYMNKLNIDEGLDAVAINKKDLPPGIMQVTVLTADGKPLAERLVFVANQMINNELLQGVTVNTDRRKKNIFAIDVHEFDKLKAAISITNADGDPTNTSTSIQSNFLLSSDIKGQINNAGYYFKDKTPETLKALDLVMMTNGWRRFKLENLMTNKLPPLQYPFETSGLSISGKVLQSNGKGDLKSGKINLIIKAEDSTSIMSEARVNEASQFVVDNIDYKKTATIYYQGTNTNKENAIVSVKLNDAYFDTLKKAKLNLTEIYNSEEAISGFNLQLIQAKQKSDTSFGKTLQNVIVKGRKRSVTDSLNTLYASDIFFDSDQTLLLDENANYFDMWQYLQRMVPGIRINKTDTGLQVNFSRYDGLNFFSGETDGGVQFYLNEVAVPIQVIDALNPGDVGIVKVYKGVTGIALGADRGAIAIYTLKGRSTKDWRQKGFDFFKKNGYSVERQFYEMDYSRLNPESSFSDVRTTLYWNPDIKIQNGKATVEFYNDDTCKKFKVIVEGIDANGKLLHVEKMIQ